MNTYDPPGGLPWGLFALCGGSLVLNTFFVTRWLMQPELAPMECDAETTVAAAAVVDAPDQLVAAVPTPAQPPGEQPVLVEAVTEEAPPIEEPPAQGFPGVKEANLVVHHSLARTFQRGVPNDGDVLSAMVARLFVWDLNLRRDLQKGDKVDVAWTGEGESTVVEAARYRSHKGVFEAFRFQAEGDTYPSWWTADGVEVARQLKNSPITGYEQITSLLKDRPRHRGMDFKAPVGTPIVTPKSATVVRTNWNQGNNGGCVEVRFGDGTTARYLHLSGTTVKAGQRVAAGETLGHSGNTGHSTAPHLHYELSKNDKVIDPVTYHGVTRRNLPASDQAAFATTVERLRTSL